ncbi:MAG: hypothetical protein FJ096_16480 [Deltaproteobacteria bacterium]|nr:hypothetical protein [Deltaproteobacteria bacterium]
MPSVSRRALGALAIFVGAGGLFAVNRALLRFPPESEPEGAYLRVVTSLEAGKPEDAFPYLEEEAQVACYTIRDYARLASAAIQADYPAAERERELSRYEPIERAGEPPRVWAHLADERGWLRRLRRDLSGVISVAVVDDRATIVTARGTRYSFRRRPNGIWGLAMFTAQLEAEAKRLARDWELVKTSAADFRKATKER